MLADILGAAAKGLDKPILYIAFDIGGLTDYMEELKPWDAWKCR